MGSERAFHIAKKIALGVGFELLKEDTAGCRMTMDASRLKDRQFIKGNNAGLTGGCMMVWKEKMQHASTILSKVQTELEYKCGISSYSEELNDMVKALLKHKKKLDTAWFEGKG